MAENKDYDDLVQNINLEDITSSMHNADILRQLRDGHPDWNKLFILENVIDGDIDEFVVGAGDDLGWLGYFIGRSEVLESLVVDYLPEEGERMDALMRGIIHNQSITELIIRTDIGDQGFERLVCFLRKNNALTRLSFEGFHVDTECGHNISMALVQCRHNSLSRFELDRNNISEEAFAEIATALRNQSQLEDLYLKYNNIGRDGCVALVNTLRVWQSSNLKCLALSDNNIDDLGLQALVEGMSNCCNLEKFNLSRNAQITAAGIRSISPLLQSESCSLEVLSLYGINFGDNGAIALADGLRGNKSLRGLAFAPTSAGITDVGWAAFSKLLCDPSSVTNTYLSNHTIERIGGDSYGLNPPNIRQYLAWNKSRHIIDAAISKILKSHSDLDMEPFFHWKLKLLPVVVNWFESARSRMLANNLGESIQSLPSRELSALYKFVRGMPALTVISYWQQFVVNAQAKRRRIDAERRRLEDERRILYYEEEVAWKRLGGRPRSEGSSTVVSGTKRRRHE